MPCAQQGGKVKRNLTEGMKLSNRDRALVGIAGIIALAAMIAVPLFARTG